MNILIKNNIINSYEGIMRYQSKITKNDYDSVNNVFPFPNNYPKYNTKNILKKLLNIELHLESIEQYTYYIKNKDCPLCGLKHISTKIYNITNIFWDDGLKHHIAQHYYKLSDNFLNFINNITIKNNEIIYNEQKTNKEKVLLRMSGMIIKKQKKSYVTISRNQLLVLDALMNDGGYTKKYIDSKNNLRYSEHSGLLDFSNNKLDKIIVSGKTIRTDRDDHEIFLPMNMIEAYDYEYMFHTHPPTPKPGGRAKDGVLYEFPSISDIFHFIEHYNNGNIQGSIIIASEGVYIIRAKDNVNKIIINNEDEVFNELSYKVLGIQNLAIEKYKTKFTDEFFYKTIAQDKSYIKKFNNLLNEYNIKIKYKPRSLIKNRWIIDGLNIIVSPIEPIYTLKK